MKAKGKALLPKIGEHFDKGSERFLNKGVNGCWKDVLTEADLARYEVVFRRKVSPACADWLEHGRLGAGDPRGPRTDYFAGTGSGPVQLQPAIFQPSAVFFRAKVIWAGSRIGAPLCLKV